VSVLIGEISQQLQPLCEHPQCLHGTVQGRIGILAGERKQAEVNFFLGVECVDRHFIDRSNDGLMRQAVA